MEIIIITAAALCIAVLAAVLLRFLGAQNNRKDHDKPQPLPTKPGKKQENIGQRFLPLALLHRIGIETTAMQEDIRTQQREFEAAVMNQNIAHFSEKIRDMEIREVYRLVNRTLERSVPVIQEHGGMVDSIRDAGCVSFFTEEPSQGLDAAVAVCEEIAKLGEPEVYRDFSTGLCYGSVMAGVVGSSSRLAVLTLSAYTGLSEFLREIAPKYSARILATESYTSRIQDFDKRYNHRFLGYVYVNALNRQEKIYDIYDGDDADVRNGKRKTKTLFEKGVGLFLNRNFQEARRYFIEVLKAARLDRAAREYVFLCDKCSALPETEISSANIWLERY